MRDCYIIAEIGSNCFKYDSQKENLELAKDQIAAAKGCGADAVKFQMFTYRELYGLSAPKGHKPTYEMPREWVPKLKEYCDHYRIDFMCSAFSVDGYKYLDEYVDRHKIASPEACSDRLVSAVQGMGNPIIISNGCLTYEEQFKLLGGNLWGADDVLLECCSKYPSNIVDYDFSKIIALSRMFSIEWGLSDHTKGVLLALIARQLGATVFEKHVDLVYYSKKETPDSCVSIDRFEFERYCKLLKDKTPDRYDKAKKSSRDKYGRDQTGYRPINGAN